MDDRDIARRLKGFEAVWRRVGNSRSAAGTAAAKGLKLMPGKTRPAQSQRHNPRRG